MTKRVVFSSLGNVLESFPVHAKVHTHYYGMMPEIVSSFETDQLSPHNFRNPEQRKVIYPLKKKMI